MSVALLLIAASPPSVPVQLSVCASVSCMSERAIHLACSIAEKEKPWHALKIVRSGGRAYELPRAEGGQAFKRTPLTWVLQDSTGEFDSFKQTELNPVEVWFQNSNGSYLIFTDRYSRLVDFTSIRIDTFNKAGKDRAARTFVGLCSIAEEPQLPLSEDERRQVLAR
jgi:hypothetical protein